jgi:transposase
VVTQHLVGGRCVGIIFGGLRNRVGAAIASGTSAQAAAGRFGVSVSTAVRWGQRLWAEGLVTETGERKRRIG